MVVSILHGRAKDLYLRKGSDLSEPLSAEAVSALEAEAAAMSDAELEASLKADKTGDD